MEKNPRRLECKGVFSKRTELATTTMKAIASNAAFSSHRFAWAWCPPLASAHPATHPPTWPATAGGTGQQ
jgi:hypothetical protein